MCVLNTKHLTEFLKYVLLSVSKALLQSIVCNALCLWSSSKYLSNCMFLSQGAWLNKELLCYCLTLKADINIHSLSSVMYLYQGSKYMYMNNSFWRCVYPVWTCALHTPCSFRFLRTLQQWLYRYRLTFAFKGSSKLVCTSAGNKTVKFSSRHH